MRLQEKFPIMTSAVTPSKMFLFAEGTQFSFCKVVFDMSRLVSKFKIFYSVVSFNLVQMMNNLLIGKVSTKMFFHHQSMFSDISVSINKWMFWGTNHSVTTISHYLSTLPMRMLFTTKFCFKITIPTFFGLESSTKVSIRLKNNFSATRYAIFNNHNMSII